MAISRSGEWPAALERRLTTVKSELQIGKAPFPKIRFLRFTMEQSAVDYRLLLPLYRNREELPILNQEGIKKNGNDKIAALKI